MRKVALGVLVGAGLGAVDGLSSWLSPDARRILLAIVTGSTLKGVVTGLLAGRIATRTRCTTVSVVTGLVIGLVLSSLSARGQPSHYWEIVLPGMLVGAFTGFVTQRYGAGAAGTTAPATTR